MNADLWPLGQPCAMEPAPVDDDEHERCNPQLMDGVAHAGPRRLKIIKFTFKIFF